MGNKGEEMNETFTLTGRIAVEMGEGWAAQASTSTWNDDAYLVGPDDVRIHVAKERFVANPRLQFHGRLPDGWLDHAPSTYEKDAPRNPKINVSSKKTPAQIAGDIRRRLLPGYAEYLAATRERKATSDAYHGDVEAHGDRLIRLAGKQAKWNDPNRHSGGKRQPLHEINLHSTPGVSYGSARVHSDGSVSLDVSLTPEGATANFLALGKLAKAE